MSEPARFLSERIEFLLATLSAGGRPSGANGFPGTVTRDTRHALRCSQSENLSNWFRRCVNDFCDGQISDCEIEENMAMFAYLEWDEPNTLSYVNISVLRADCGLIDYYLDENGNHRAQYLRLDLDYKTIGPIFAHPLPHVHAISHEPAARFELDPFNSSNIVVDFFEFVYRHLQHDRWLDWARSVWRPYFQERASEFGDHMETVISAFGAGDIELLATFDRDIREMRRMIHHRKSEITNPARPNARLFDLTMRQADRELVSFTHGL